MASSECAGTPTRSPSSRSRAVQHGSRATSWSGEILARGVFSMMRAQEIRLQCENNVESVDEREKVCPLVVARW